MQEEKPILVIGAAIFDLMGFPHLELIPFDSIPGRLEMASGGVGRNIAENLHQLGLNTKLISVFGDDVFSEIMRQQAAEIGLDISHSRFLQNQKGLSHLAMMDSQNNMINGIADLAAIEALDSGFLASKLTLINNAEVLVVETNIPKSSLEYLFKNLPSDISVFLDPVSGPMAVKVKDYLSEIHTLKANLIEAEALFGKPIRKVSDLENAANFFMKKGVEQVIITQGAKSIFYADKDQLGEISPKTVQVINTTGAGDAMMAGLVMGYLRAWPIEKTVRFGITCAEMTISHPLPVNPLVNLKTVMERLKQQKSKDE